MWIYVIDVAAEKTQKALLEGVEAFDTGRLKHTETNEKNPLPDKTGKYNLINPKFFFLFRVFWFLSLCFACLFNSWVKEWDRKVY